MELSKFKSLEVGESVLVEVPKGRSFDWLMKKHSSYASRNKRVITQTSFSAANYEKGELIGVVKVTRLQ